MCINHVYNRFTEIFTGGLSDKTFLKKRKLKLWQKT